MVRRLLLTLFLLLSPLPVTASASASSGNACADCPEMADIPGGVLHRTDGGSIDIAPFRLARTEVTFDDYQRCVSAGACRGGQDDHGWGRGRRPVINVSVADVDAYLVWLSRHTGQRFRLPTEDEWEWAARGGTTSHFWWGDEAGQGHANCRYCGPEDGGKRTSPVASYPANPFGVFDTAGNVWEWVADCWADRRDAPPEKRDCRYRVAKGGAWYYIPDQARPDRRARQRAEMWSYTVGFRVAQD